MTLAVHHQIRLLTEDNYGDWLIDTESQMLETTPRASPSMGTGQAGLRAREEAKGQSGGYTLESSE